MLGDQIRSNLPHILSNPTDEVVMGYSILTPVVWFPSTHRSPKPDPKNESMLKKPPCGSFFHLT